MPQAREIPAPLRDVVELDQDRWESLTTAENPQAAIFRTFVDVVLGLDGPDRRTGGRLLAGLPSVAERYNGALRGIRLALPWQGAARELGHVVEIALPSGSERDAFVAEAARRGCPLHLEDA